MEYQALTALATGDFASLRVLKDGSMQEVLTLIQAGGGGSGGSGSGIVTSASAPLSISNGVLSLNLSGFATAATSPLELRNGLLTVDLSGYQGVLTAGSNVTISGNTISVALPSSQPISFITGLQVALNGKVDDSQVLTNVPAKALFTDTCI